MPVLLLLHVPPDPLCVSVTVAPGHTPDGPLRLPALGNELMAIAFVAKALPQAFVTVYLIVSVPATTPVTNPPVDTDALVLDALHTPPGAGSVKVTDAPAHTLAGPVIVPADGAV